MLTYNGQALTYDANGNLTQRQTAQGPITYTWDAQNRLVGISGPNGQDLSVPLCTRHIGQWGQAPNKE